MQKIQNYINGNYCDPVSGKWLDNYNPSNGEVYAQIANSSSKDVAAAYEAARDAFPSWSNTPIEERSRILLKIATLIEEKMMELATAEAKDNGKPLSLA
ncbi:MAG: aldehyde dehydrogenase family protein, partial [Altibacter sp.]|nr:aldehyde dehydrogenase family protein [Altibacter sp.]